MIMYLEKESKHQQNHLVPQKKKHMTHLIFMTQNYLIHKK